MKNKLIIAQSLLQFPFGSAVFSLDPVLEKEYADLKYKLTCQTEKHLKCSLEYLFSI